MTEGQGWRHSSADWTSTRSNLATFVDLLVAACKEKVGDWKDENYDRAISWANYFEKLMETLPRDDMNGGDGGEEDADVDEVSRLHEDMINHELSRLISMRFDAHRFRFTLNTDSLSCARHFLLRQLLNNAFLTPRLLRRVIVDYLEIGREVQEGEEEMKGADRRKLVQDIAKRAKSQAVVNVLLQTLQLSSAHRNQEEEEEKEDQEQEGGLNHKRRKGEVIEVHDDEEPEQAQKKEGKGKEKENRTTGNEKYMEKKEEVLQRLERLRMETSSSYLFEPRVVAKRAYAKLLREDFRRLLSSSSYPSSTSSLPLLPLQQLQYFLSTLRQAIDIDPSCLETICLQLLPSTSSLAVASSFSSSSSLIDNLEIEVNRQIESFLLTLLSEEEEEKKKSNETTEKGEGEKEKEGVSSVLWSLSPWLLTELSEHHSSFFQSYLLHLQKKTSKLMQLLPITLTSHTLDSRKRKQPFSSSSFSSSFFSSSSSSSSSSSQLEREVEECRVSLYFLIKRSSRLKQSCEEAFSKMTAKLSHYRRSAFLSSFYFLEIKNNH